jgi:hypothetical protein
VKRGNQLNTISVIQLGTSIADKITANVHTALNTYFKRMYHTLAGTTGRAVHDLLRRRDRGKAEEQHLDNARNLNRVRANT